MRVPIGDCPRKLVDPEAREPPIGEASGPVASGKPVLVAGQDRHPLVDVLVDGAELPQPLLATLAEDGSGAMMPPSATLIGAQVWKAFRDGRLADAAEAQRAFSRFPGKWSSYGLPPVMKCALGHLGIDVGKCPPPFGVLGSEEAEGIGLALIEIGLTTTTA